MADTVAVMNEGVIEQMGAPGGALREPAQHVRRELPRPVQPDRGHGRAAATPTWSPSTCTGIGVSVPAGRAPRRRRPRLGRHPAREGADRGGGRGARRAGQHHPRRRRQRRQLRRGQHAVPRPDALGPGAHGLRAEHRSPRGSSRRATGRAVLATGVRLPARPRPGRVGRRRSGGGDAWRRWPDAPPARRPRRRGWTGYLLLLPGAAVAGALLRRPALLPGRDQPVRPLRVATSAATTMTWQCRTTPTRCRRTGSRCCARSCTAGSPPLLCLLLGYVLAYAIAFKAGRWKNLMLVAGDRAVLHQLPDPHPVVEAAPGRRRLRREHPAGVHLLGRRRTAAGHAGRGDRRPDLQLPAVHGAAALRQPRQDRPAADRGRRATSTRTRSSASGR